MSIDQRLFAGMDGEKNMASTISAHIEDISQYGAASVSRLREAMDAVFAFLITGQSENGGNSSIEYVMSEIGKFHSNLEAIRKGTEDETTVFTVHDPFSDCTYVKRTLKESKQVADDLAAGLIVEVKNNDRNTVVCRYFRYGDIWVY